jgi:hypothetical protein
LSVRANIQ